MIGTIASIMSSTIVNVAVPDMSTVFALGPGTGPMDVDRLHGRDDRLDADHALAAVALGLPAHLFGRDLLLLVGGVAGGFAGTATSS